MKPAILLFIIFAVVVATFSCQQGTTTSKSEKPSQSNSSTVPHNTLSKQEIAEGWELLFDGETIDKWKNYGKETVKGWEVKDGEMIALGKSREEGGDIITRAAYDNFMFKVEWKVSEAANSGIMFRVVDDPSTYKKIHETGPEYQLLDDIGYPGEVEDYQLTATNYAMHASDNRPIKQAGEWNTSKIVVNGSHVEHWLNGAKVLEYELWSEDWENRKAAGKWKDYPAYGMAKSGHIALQDHGNKIWFRNIKVRAL